ncbi:MAG: hypothetical protein ACI9VR_005063 [Cognaticolwellia sp.]|jgi:hypothetical protein
MSVGFLKLKRVCVPPTGVPAMRLVFDQDHEILVYSGLVPPLEEVDGRLEKLDATVTYSFAGTP